MESRIYNETIRKLENELSDIKATANCFVDLTEKAIGLCDMVIIKLREIVLRDGFKDDAEEIYFFKYVKPLY